MTRTNEYDEDAWDDEDDEFLEKVPVRLLNKVHKPKPDPIKLSETGWY